jgi:hypothetical protein
MALIQSAAQSVERAKKYAAKVGDILKEFGVTGPKSLVSVAKSSPEFRSKWTSLFKEIADAEGGKLGLGTVGMIVGLALGGIGIGGFFGAVGVPLALVLGGLGLFTGVEIDDLRSGTEPTTKVKIPRALFDRIRLVSEKTGRDPVSVITSTLEVAFSDETVSQEVSA